MRYYFITDPLFYTLHTNTFSENLQSIIDNSQVSMLCFRDKTSSPAIKEQRFEEFLAITQKYSSIYRYINRDIGKALHHNLDGVHLQSNQFDSIKEAKNAGLHTIISCHSQRDIEKAESLGADAMTLSPIFASPNKGNPLGMKYLQEVLGHCKESNIIALGGIVDGESIAQLPQNRLFGVASIRFFEKFAKKP